MIMIFFQKKSFCETVHCFDFLLKFSWSKSNYSIKERKANIVEVCSVIGNNVLTTSFIVENGKSFFKGSPLVQNRTIKYPCFHSRVCSLNQMWNAHMICLTTISYLLLSVFEPENIKKSYQEPRQSVIVVWWNNLPAGFHGLSCYIVWGLNSQDIIPQIISDCLGNIY